MRTWAIRTYRTAYKLKPKNKDYAKALRRLSAGRTTSAKPVRAGGATNAAEKKRHAVACVRGSAQATVRGCNWLIRNRAYPGKRHILISNLGWGYYRLKQNGRALADFSKAISMNPRYVKAYHNRVLVLFRLGRFKQAVRDLHTIIRLKPRNDTAHFNLGLAYKALGNRAAAIRAFRAGQRIAPRNTNFAKQLRRMGVQN